MWVASKYGWFSIVQKKPGEFHVRARRREDLEGLAKAMLTDGNWEQDVAILKSYRGSDYPWRMIVKHDALAAVMRALMESVDYDNFKDKIWRTPWQAYKHEGYAEMWAIAKGWEVRR